ncbi:MAG: histidinol phosphatase-like enzyme (inositol monophosphatase family) [Lentimonas sp.]|jgi:histidinol phosphatase-like enzyme (inositol monophosphatase family)
MANRLKPNQSISTHKMIKQEFVEFANYLADISENVATKYFRHEFFETSKEDQSPVTLADKETEEVIRNAIKNKFPDHGIIGEEFAAINEGAKYQWVIDPIDGTISFVIGRPIFGNLIALCEDGEPILGVINQPIAKERWVGIKDGDAFFNGKKIQTRKCQNLSDAVLCSTSPFFFQGKDLEMLNKISSQTKYQSQGGIIYGGDCYLFGLLAMGQIDVIIEQGLNSFDFAALATVVESAGGIITDWKGNSLNINSDGKILACGDKNLHKELLKMLN